MIYRKHCIVLMLRSRDLSSGDSLFGSWNTFLCMTFLMCVYECKEHILCKSACEGACVSACLRQQFRAAQSMLGSLSLQIRQGEITQVHRGENPPSPILYLSVSLSLLLPHSFIALHYCSITSASWTPCVDQSEELNVKHIQILLLVLLQNKFLLLLSLFVPLCRWLNYIYWVHSVQEWVHFILKLNDMLSLVNPIIHIRTLHKYHYSDFRLHGLLSLSQGCYMCVKYLTWTVWPVSCLTTRTWPSSWRGNSSV